MKYTWNHLQKHTAVSALGTRLVVSHAVQFDLLIHRIDSLRADCALGGHFVDQGGVTTESGQYFIPARISYDLN